MATAQEYKDAYARIFQNNTLTDAQAAALAAQDSGAGYNTPAFQTWANGLTTNIEAVYSTGGVVAIWSVITGRVPSTADLKGQVDTIEALTQQYGSSSIAFKGMGASLANSPFAGAFAATYNQDTNTLLGQQTFVSQAFVKAFGREPTIGELNTNVGVFQIVKANYAKQPVTETTTDARAKGEFLADLVKQAFDFSIGPNADLPIFDQAQATIVALGSNTYVPNAPIETQPGAPTGVAGKTFTLSVNADGPGAAAPAVDTTGTDGNDVFNGTDATITSADNLVGNGGIDTVNIRATAAGAAAPQSSSVEVVNVTNVSAGQFNLNVTSMAGATTLVSKDSIATSQTTFSNITSPTTVVSVLDNADGRTDFNYSGAAGRTGTADQVNISVLNGSGTATAPAVLNITTATGLATDGSFENLNLTTGGASSVVTSNLGLENIRVLTVTGNAAADASGYGLTLTEAANFAAMRTVNASGMNGTGGINVNVSAANFASLAFTGSAQNDRVVVNGGNAAATWSLAGGLGTDTLAVGTSTVFSAANAAVLTNVINAATGFEVLEATAANVTAIDANDFTAINTFRLSGAIGASLAITDVETGDRFVVTNDGTVAGDVVTLTGAVAGQSTTFELNANATNGNITLVATGAGNNALTVNGGITNVALVSGGTNAAANELSAAAGVAAVDNVTATNFTATGSQALTVGAVAGLATPLGFSQAVSFDASALTGVLRVAGSGLADQIIGGTAADIIYGRAGNDVLTGNGGADQFRFIAANEGNDRITDFAVGTDKVGILSGFVNFGATAASQAGQTLAAADYVEARNDITGIVAGDAAKVVELQTSLTTAQLTTQVGAAVAAVVLVHNSTTGKAELWYDADWSDVAADRVQIASFDNITDLAGVKSFSATDFVEFLV